MMGKSSHYKSVGQTDYSRSKAACTPHESPEGNFERQYSSKPEGLDIIDKERATVRALDAEIKGCTRQK